MIKQRRASKSRALKVLESYYNDKGRNDGGNQSSPLDESESNIYDDLYSIFDSTGNGGISNYNHHLHQHQNNSKQPTVATRISLSNVKKKFIAEQFKKNIFVPTEIIMSKGKGNGVKVLQDVEPGVLVVEYKGELIKKQEALRREKEYARNSTSIKMDCYLFFFEHNGKEMCVDPTTPSEDFGHGRYINHKVEGNLDPIKIQTDGVPKIVLISNRAIRSGEELFFDYGDRSSTSLAYFPWLRDDYKPLSDDEEDPQEEQVVAKSTPSSTSSSTTTPDNRQSLKLKLKRVLIDSITSPNTTTYISETNFIKKTTISFTTSCKPNNNINLEEEESAHINSFSLKIEKEKEKEQEKQEDKEKEIPEAHINSFDDSESPGEMSDLDLGSIGYYENNSESNSGNHHDTNLHWRTNIYELNLPTSSTDTGNIYDGSDVSDEQTQQIFQNVKRIKLKFKEKTTES